MKRNRRWAAWKKFMKQRWDGNYCEVDDVIRALPKSKIDCNLILLALSMGQLLVEADEDVGGTKLPLCDYHKQCTSCPAYNKKSDCWHCRFSMSSDANFETAEALYAKLYRKRILDSHIIALEAVGIH